MECNTIMIYKNLDHIMILVDGVMTLIIMIVFMIIMMMMMMKRMPHYASLYQI